MKGVRIITDSQAFDYAISNETSLHKACQMFLDSHKEATILHAFFMPLSDIKVLKSYLR